MSLLIASDLGGESECSTKGKALTQRVTHTHVVQESKKLLLKRLTPFFVV